MLLNLAFPVKNVSEVKVSSPGNVVQLIHRHEEPLSLER